MLNIFGEVPIGNLCGDIPGDYAGDVPIGPVRGDIPIPPAKFGDVPFPTARIC